VEAIFQNLSARTVIVNWITVMTRLLNSPCTLKASKQNFRPKVLRATRLLVRCQFPSASAEPI
jgi:hypothetical protein